MISFFLANDLVEIIEKCGSVCCRPKICFQYQCLWYWRDILGGVSLLKMTSPPPTFNLRITWMIIILDNSWGSEERTVRGSVSHIDAKYTRREKWKGYQTAVISVLRCSWKLNYRNHFFCFCSALLIKRYFGIWSSVYLQLLQYFILFLLPLQWWTILVIIKRLLKRKKMKNAVQFSGNASSCSS